MVPSHINNMVETVGAVIAALILSNEKVEFYLNPSHDKKRRIGNKLERH